ncbi:alpha/beta hydrolase [Stratiformator vulcanicus]|uniref:Alpha/beta hydrolase family protein n=1 Tax=Stratiformator vulcanicus TaxID=2527980 RepID=A0A517QYK8_9PLAN|nr:hypothetical protein [Stratiformator vulcanicus]QDT36725.1 Alpha/beta hydrolase family protein [Stratiformator vulcanicus]
MFQRLRSNVIDELVGWLLLKRVLRYRNLPPVSGAYTEQYPALLSGDRSQFFGSLPNSRPLNLMCHEIRRTDEFAVDEIRCRSSMTSSFPENNEIIGRRWRPLGEARTRRAVVMVDGLVQRDERPQEVFARHSLKRDTELVAVDLPFNHRRTPDGYRPGQLLVGGDVDHTFGVFRQAVRDVWTVVRATIASGREVSLAGISFGGWVVLTVATLESSLKSALAITPPVDMLGLLTEGGVIVKAAKESLRLEPAEIAEMRPLAAPISLLDSKPLIAGSDITLVAATYDRFVPTDRVLELSALWRTKLIELPIGHIEATRSRRGLDRIAHDWFAQSK